MPTYGYKENRPQPSLDAQVVGDELERIRVLRGELTTEGVVQESKPKRSILHKEIDWHRTDRECAEDWRKHKARNVINVVTVIPEKPDGDTIAHPAPAFVNITHGVVSSPESRTYEPLAEVLADPVKRSEMVQRALEKLMRVQREFRYLNELSTIWATIDAEVEKLASVVE